MERFHPDMWKYNPTNPGDVLTQLPRELIDARTIESLLTYLRTYGGKALGLSVCEQLCDGSEHLRVPSWCPLPLGFSLRDATTRADTWLGGSTSGVKVRSSTRAEDWISGESGEQNSRSVLSHARVPVHAVEVSLMRHPVVLQKLIDGIGIVVDIAYSQILKRPIARISTGRESIDCDGITVFSSATTDHEGRHEILDPETGTALLPRCTGKLFSGSCLQLPLDRLAQELWECVRRLGITFAVQFELVIHPAQPDVWWLVQVRPAPNHLRSNGHVYSALQEPLVTTQAVSRPFSYTQIAGVIKEEDVFWLLQSACGGPDWARTSLGRDYPSPEILVWEEDQIRPDFALEQLHAGFLAGAKVQITRQVLVVSTSHNRIRPPTKRDNLLMNDVGVIALPDNVHDHLVKLLRSNHQRLTVISDGYVGQVALC